MNWRKLREKAAKKGDDKALSKTHYTKPFKVMLHHHLHCSNPEVRKPKMQLICEAAVNARVKSFEKSLQMIKLFLTASIPMIHGIWDQGHKDIESYIM